MSEREVRLAGSEARLAGIGRGVAMVGEEMTESSMVSYAPGRFCGRPIDVGRSEELGLTIGRRGGSRELCWSTSGEERTGCSKTPYSRNETPRKDGGEDSPGAAVTAEIVAIKWSHTAPLSCSAQCAKDRYEALYAYALDL